MSKLTLKGFSLCPLCGCSLYKKPVDGRKRLVCRGCGWVYYKNPLPVAICVAKNKEGKILIVKRNLNPGINKWALPGGFIEFNETPEMACLRELKEETGLKGKIRKLIGVYTQKTREYGLLIILGYEVVVYGGSLLLNNELKDAKFISKRNLPIITFSSHRKIIKET